MCLLLVFSLSTMGLAWALLCDNAATVDEPGMVPYVFSS